MVIQSLLINTDNDYLNKYSQCKLDEEDKDRFCRINPQSFLFQADQAERKFLALFVTAGVMEIDIRQGDLDVNLKIRDLEPAGN